MNERFNLQTNIENFLKSNAGFLKSVSDSEIASHLMPSALVVEPWDSRTTIFVAVGDHVLISTIKKGLCNNVDVDKKCYNTYNKSNGFCHNFEYWRYFFKKGSEIVQVVFCRLSGFDYISKYFDRTELTEGKTNDLSHQYGGIPFGAC